MKIHCIRHESFEGLGCIGDWISSKGFETTYTLVYQNPVYPQVEEFDWLIVMGGGMSVYEDDKYLWISAEKELIRNAIEKGKVVLGICLGAQFIASAMGARVYQGKRKEIGWFPVNFSKNNDQNDLLGFLPDSVTVFHWHGDTFDIPTGAAGFASSAVTPNQGFIIGDRVVGLQFHFEITETGLLKMINGVNVKLLPEEFVQSPEEMKDYLSYIPQNNQLMHKLLDRLAAIKN
jgi:GMP synthase-like glutamine amidotransferase